MKIRRASELIGKTKTELKKMDIIALTKDDIIIQGYVEEGKINDKTVFVVNQFETAYGGNDYSTSGVFENFVTASDLKEYLKNK